MILKSSYANATLRQHFDKLNVTIAQGDPCAVILSLSKNMLSTSTSLMQARSTCPDILSGNFVEADLLNEFQTASKLNKQ